MRISLCQLQIEYERKEVNLNRVEKIIQEAVAQKSELLLFPEMSFTGFSMNTKLTGEENGITLRFMIQLAQRYQIAIGFGWVKNRENSENHYTVVDCDGKILGDYIKIHPFSYSGENQFFVAGGQMVAFTYKGIRFGLTICYDLRFPELYQRLSDKAEILIVAANWPKERISHWNILLQARAIENQVYMVGLNCTGIQGDLTYNGHSQVIYPDGRIYADLGEEELLETVEIQDDVATYRSKFPMRQDRKRID